MGIIEAIILGIIQGLTEFLPVSSSGHLILGEHLMGVESTETVLFIIVVHAATALSTIVVFRKFIGKIIWDLLKFSWNDSYNFTLFIIISMIPAGLVGFFMEDMIDGFLEDPSNELILLIVVGICLFITGFLLLLSESIKGKRGILNYWKSFVIGVAQAIAILPGISRSGATISTSLLLNLNRAKAAKFSFLMALPVILGAMLKKLIDLMGATEEVGIPSEEKIAILPLVFGFIAAFISGWIACKWMIRIVKRSKLKYFAFYCFAVGILALGLGIFST